MTYVYLTLALSLPPLWFWRFKDVELDRDWTLYVYRAVFGRKGDHFDNKPPLTGMLWVCWQKCFGTLRYDKTGPQGFRLPILIGMMLSTCSIAYAAGPFQALVFACVLVSPSMWPHAANTEWITNTLWALALAAAIHSPALAGCLLGLSALVNQKNIILLLAAAVIGYATDGITFSLITSALFTAIVGYLLTVLIWGPTKALETLVLAPRRLSRARNFKTHVLGQANLFVPSLGILAPILAIQHSLGWGLIALIILILAAASKQVMPYHLSLLAIPLALGSTESPLFFVGVLAVWSMRDLWAWINPAKTWRLTFTMKGGHDYSQILAEGQKVADWLKLNLKQGEKVFLNGWENNVYVQANVPAWFYQAPESWRDPKKWDRPLPRIAIHSGIQGHAMPFDYEAAGYRVLDTTPGGTMTILTREKR